MIQLLFIIHNQNMEQLAIIELLSYLYEHQKKSDRRTI
jgi:hypothetical protein